MKVFVVTATRGQYSDRSFCVEGVFDSLEGARTYVADCEARQRAAGKRDPVPWPGQEAGPMYVNGEMSALFRAYYEDQWLRESCWEIHEEGLEVQS